MPPPPPHPSLRYPAGSPDTAPRPGGGPPRAIRRRPRSPPPDRRPQRLHRQPARTGPVDSGGIRLIGLPRGSTVMIDEKPVTQPLTRLAPGPHALAISAPRYNFYSDTIVVRPGQLQELTPQLTRSAPRAARAPAGNARGGGLRPGRGLQRRWLLLRRAAQAGQPAVRHRSRRRRALAPAVAALGQGLGRGPHGGHHAAPPVR